MNVKMFLIENLPKWIVISMIKLDIVDFNLQSEEQAERWMKLRA